MSTRRLAVLLAGGLTAGSLALVVAPGLTSAVPATCDTTAKTAFTLAGRYDTGDAATGQTAAEIVAAEGDTAYVMTFSAIEVVDISNPSAPVQTGTLVLPNDPTSVAVHEGLVAVSVPAVPKTDPGQVRFFRDGALVKTVTVGALPDMVTFTGNGKYLLVANEGEPNSYGQPTSVDPEGSVSVIDIRTLGRATPTVTTLGFAAFNEGGTRPLPTGVRIYGPGASVAQDLEPEYITTSDNHQKAWVTLQENNALAVIDLKGTPAIESIVALGTSDHSRPGFSIDASDRSAAGIDNRNWPVKGLYLPDGIASYKTGGRDYVITANEGDARDWVGLDPADPTNAEEYVRAKDAADLTLFPDAADELLLGRLNVTPFEPATANGAGKLTSLYSSGSRSFTIREADGSVVWDSGDQLECITAATYPTQFNASNSNNTFKNRSDDKGPEPESVLVANIDDRQLAFVALERIGGVVVYDVTDPAHPVFQQYLTTRAFSGPTDNGPEGLALVPAEESPTGVPLLLVGHEVTGTVVIWSLGS